MNAQKRDRDFEAKGTVVGLFHNQPEAEEAIRELREVFSEDQIGVLMRDREKGERLASETGTKVSESATAGAVGGGIAGGVLGLLAGVGALAIPGVGPLIAGGALASTLAGAGIGAAAGGLIGALVGMGIPEEDARYFEQELHAGGILVTVSAGTRAEEARRILRSHGARLEAEGRETATSRGTTAEGERLELREEELRTEKERVQAGEVRLRKEVVEEQRTIDVPVTREEVVIERQPVSGRQTSDADIQEGEEIRIPVMEEEVRVEKTPVVKEEVTVGKRQIRDTERVSETVRREEARVETDGEAELATGGSRSEAWRGNERRYRNDTSYTGPERRLANV